ncbi:GNAT family N-acetyltransferase [Methanosphaera sp.]
MKKHIKRKYHRITKDYEYELIQSKNKSLEKIVTNTIAEEMRKSNSETYIILDEYEIIGFFTLRIADYDLTSNNRVTVLKIVCLYIYDSYRFKGIGTEVLNDIIWSIKNKDCDINHVFVNSFVDSARFFLKNGFDFYKRNKHMNYKNKRNIITLYKKLK